MIKTRPMTARRTQDFLRDLNFRKHEINDMLIEAYLKSGGLLRYTQEISIRISPHELPQGPSKAHYIVEIGKREDTENGG